MKPTKNNLKEEIEYRIACIEAVLMNEKEELVYNILANEQSILAEILELIKTFENRIGFKKFEASKYTPLLCFKTKEPLLIGDLVENNNKMCGTLHFDDYTKRYVIKGVEGGHVHGTVFIKIPKLYEFKIDAGRVECRPPGKYLKRRW